MKSAIKAINSILFTLLVILLSNVAPNAVLGQAVLEQPTRESSTEKAKHKSDDSLYMQILRDKDDEPIAMQTSIVSFTHREEGKPGDKKGRGVVVDLIGAVHVADKQYFKQLNRVFPKYDSLLYELVAPKENNVPQGGSSQHPVGQLQQQMKSMLSLSYQLEEVDYTKRNFVHADMSPEEFANVMVARDESWLQMMMKMMGASLATQGAKGKSTDADMLFALFAKPRERALRLKRVMATQFGDLEGMMGVLEGEKGSTIIGMRNKKALDVLRSEMTKGKKRIGIFYGAGHFPDMEKRLAEGFGMYPDKKSIKWLTAWDMKD